MQSETLFETDPISSEIQLIYFPQNNTMPAVELGEAIIGLEACLREAAKVGLLYHEGIYVKPIERGSVKTQLRYIRKHPFQIIASIDLVVNLFSNSFQLIDRFGANDIKNPSKEVLEQINNKQVLDLCRSFHFKEGLQKIAQPLNEENEKVHIVIGDKTLEITCDNKYRFYVDKQEDPILPELLNGEIASIEGEITRINKKVNDLGFNYKGYTLNVSPLDKEKSTSNFHEYLEMDKVLLKGIVIRNSEFEVPKIKVIEITPLQDKQQKMNLDQ